MVDGCGNYQVTMGGVVLALTALAKHINEVKPGVPERLFATAVLMDRQEGRVLTSPFSETWLRHSLQVKLRADNRATWPLYPT